jgi:hypothetical protein
LTFNGKRLGDAFFHVFVYFEVQFVSNYLAELVKVNRDVDSLL